MRITLKCSLMAGLFLPLCVIAYPGNADDGQLSSWEDSNYIDYPPPPEGGWEPLVPNYDPDADNTGDDSGNTQNVNSANQAVAKPAPSAPAPQQVTSAAVPSTMQAYTAPATPQYAAPGWPPALIPGYGYAWPGYNPAVTRPVYPAPVYPSPVFNRGYAPAYPVPGAVPGNRGNPWNDGQPGGWAATAWGERGPAGWTYPTAADSTDLNNTQNAVSQNTATAVPDAGVTAPDEAVAPPEGAANKARAPVRGFNWYVQ